MAAPSSAAREPAHAREGLESLNARGFDVVTSRELDGPPVGYLSDSDEVRAEELNDFLRRDDIDAIFCLRGGYGAHRILEVIDYDAARQHPKLLVGYSDITALQLALLTKSGVPSISGPMVAPDWPRINHDTEDLFWKIAGGKAPVELQLPESEPLSVIKKGATEGMLIGGNLTILCSLLGTPYLPDFSGAILFLEDVGEPPYKIDRMLAQLKLAGILEQLGGLVLGAFTCVEPTPPLPTLSIDEVLHHYAGFVNGPVVGGFAYGHFPNKCTVPIGVQASLETHNETATLVVTEAITRHV
ncbi:MAG: LD-carboxypeptidase [Rubricoccaceae bacterium]|nr:LD-carboxypeptidase [Rubricoccaceae bacterium]